MKKSWFILLATFAFVVFGVLGGIWGWWNHWANEGVSSDPTPVLYEVRPGAYWVDVADELGREGLLNNKQAFRFLVRLNNLNGRLKVGEYQLRRNMSPWEIVRALTSGISYQRSITISEGLNIYDIAILIEQNKIATREEFIKLVRDRNFIRPLLGNEPETLEGYLYPETYSVTKYTSLKELVEKMVRTFVRVYQEVEEQSLLPHWSRHRIVTLASIIEKETGAPHERGLIASVFHNRLRKKMRLQTDPTIMYGIADQTGVFEVKISREDIHRPTRYNTYVIYGLPPGPIANPGKDALLAAMRPEQSDYLFFVSRNDGTHIFSESYGDHSSAVKKFQVDPKARQGKSWRDLNKKKTN